MTLTEEGKEVIFNDLQGNTQLINKEQLKEAWELYKNKLSPYKSVEEPKEQTFITENSAFNTKILELKEQSTFCAKYNRDSEEQEMVNNPEHYGGKDNPYEAIKVIEAWSCNFNIGNAIKYLSRAGKKDKDCSTQDLLKAIWYINREIENINKLIPKDNVKSDK